MRIVTNTTGASWTTTVACDGCGKWLEIEASDLQASRRNCFNDVYYYDAYFPTATCIGCGWPNIIEGVPVFVLEHLGIDPNAEAEEIDILGDSYLDTPY